MPVFIDTVVEEWKAKTLDPSFAAVSEWKSRTGMKAAGYFPVYTPMELIYACGLLPVGLTGAGNQLEIINADARFGSFICSIAKSTMELGMRKNLSPFDVVFFHSICDTARNLAFLFKRNFEPELSVEYIHFPQNTDSAAAVEFLVTEYERILRKLEGLTGKIVEREDIRRSIGLYNANRSWLRELYNFRKRRPDSVSATEVYVLVKAGHLLPPEEHSMLLAQAITDLTQRPVRTRDKIRVVLEGSFCEQPPLELLQALDEAGCSIVDDDLLLGRRWYETDIPITDDPLRALAESYVKKSVYSSVRHDMKRTRMDGLLKKVHDSNANAVVFCIAKFCEPAFFDYVLLKEALEHEQIPHLLVEFEEKMWTFEKARTEIETFVESLMFD
jgi:benzoyl-CoA reductase subunit C